MMLLRFQRTTANAGKKKKSKVYSNDDKKYQ